MENRPMAISKVLSLNDTGETGGHQAGILVPKGGDVLNFFPDLGCNEKNPRVALYFTDAFAKRWKFNFIYYNNKFFDEKGTRNEYRLTGMTSFIRENSLRGGDTITLLHHEDGNDFITYKRNETFNLLNITSEEGKEKKRLIVGDNWKVIDY